MKSRQTLPGAAVKLAFLLGAHAYGQTLPPHEAAVQSVSSGAEQPGQAASATESRLDAVSKLLAQTQLQLQQTQQQLSALSEELKELRSHAGVAASATTAAGAAVAGAQPSRSSSSAEAGLKEELARQREEQEIQSAEIKQHDQTKVESVSKYPVRVYGLLLFNAFSNAGVVDNPDLPSIALPRTPGQSNGSVGGSFRQTLLGLSGEGPKIFGASTSGDVSIDFFGDPSYNFYSSSNGNLRLRRGDIRLAWSSAVDSAVNRDVVQLGVDAPLISPLSPTSIATVAIPALAWAGNLWTWAPEIQYKHTVVLNADAESAPRTFELEGGLWDAPVVGSNALSASRILSTGELSRRPGLLGRASLHAGSSDHPLSFGVGGYVARETYTAQQIDDWAITGDWQIPLSKRFQLSGEIYRGLGLGGLGGGAYKDALQGTNVNTGVYQLIGLNAVGGWAQWKTYFGRSVETNLAYGQDDAFASDFRQLDLSKSVYSLEQNARAQMMFANLLYRPKTYLIFSPEYRRLLNWSNTGPVATANLFTLSVGYQF